MSPEPGPAADDRLTMRCMEIWGGNRVTRTLVAMPGLDVWVASEPHLANPQGGDVHYVSLCGGGIISRLIVADVSGHGAKVAGFAESLRDLMRRNINRKSQRELVKSLNRQFGELAQSQRFATAVVATYLARTDRLAICNAAHPRPLWYRAGTQRWMVMARDAVAEAGSLANLPLGVDDDSAYDQYVVTLEPGDLVLIYTDALTEAADEAGQMLGEPGLLRIAETLDPTAPEHFGPRLLAEVARHRGGQVADDDVTLLVLRHTGGPARRAGLGEKLDIYAKVFGLRAV